MSAKTAIQETFDLSTLPPLPKSWKWCVPADCCSVIASGSTPKPDLMYSEVGDVPFIKVYNLTHRGVLDFSVKPTFIDLATHIGPMSRSRAMPNDVLINIVGPPLGKVAIVPDDHPHWNINQAVVLFRPLDGVLSKYLAYAFLTDSIMRRVTSLAKATAGQSNIGVSMCRRLLPLPIAPTNEQHRIVAKIEELFSELDAGVVALKRAKANLKRYRAAVLKAAVEGKLTEEWRAKHLAKEPASALLARILKERRQKWEAEQLAKFAAADKEPPKNWKNKYFEPTPPDTDGLPDLPDGWCWATANQLCSQITDGEHIQPPYQEEGFPMLTATHVRNGQVEFKNVRNISESDFRRCLQRCAPAQGDVLIVSVGATTGRAGIVQECVPFALVRSVLLLKPIKTGTFLLNWIQSPWCQTWIGRASGATAQAHFYISDAKRMPVPLPPEDEQAVIVNEVDRCLTNISAAEGQIENNLVRAVRLRQSILKQAFEGKLVPQDPNDEPAKVLLEQLSASHPIPKVNSRVETQANTKGRRATKKQLEGTE